MKNITLIDSNWKQRISTVVTVEEQSLLMADYTLENRESKRILSESIKNRCLIDISTEESLQAQLIYDANKLDGSELISVDMTFPDGNGIINCRVNGEHKQIRF